jgi:polar amino acid transport system substrate-binding protein
MKKLVIVVAGLLLTISLAQAPDLGGVNLSVATDATYPPFESVDEATDTIVGFEVDLVNAICDIVNCAATYTNTAWDGIFVALQAGEYDMVMGGASITAEREEVMDFTQPFMTVNQSIVVRTEDEGITLEEFQAASDKKLGTIANTTNADLGIELFGRDRVALYDTFPATSLALLNGDIDGILIDNTAGDGLIQANAGQMVIAIEDLTSGDPLGFVFQEGSEYVDAFDYALTQLTEDGTLEELLTKWFTAE